MGKPNKTGISRGYLRASLALLATLMLTSTSTATSFRGFDFGASKADLNLAASEIGAAIEWDGRTGIVYFEDNPFCSNFVWLDDDGRAVGMRLTACFFNISPRSTEEFTQQLVNAYGGQAEFSRSHGGGSGCPSGQTWNEYLGRFADGEYFTADGTCVGYWMEVRAVNGGETPAF